MLKSDIKAHLTGRNPAATTANRWPSMKILVWKLPRGAAQNGQTDAPTPDINEKSPIA
jgi:hypothetical protein